MHTILFIIIIDITTWSSEQEDAGCLCSKVIKSLLSHKVAALRL